MFVRNLMTTALAVSTLAWTGMHLAPEASAAEQSSGLIADRAGKALRLWYDEPAPDSNAGWVNRSIPMGNGYMGVNVFGGTATERIQITENSLYSSTEGRGFRRGGLNNFAEVYIDFGHTNTSNYERESNLNEGVSHVNYEQDGVAYSREYFTSYPDKVMAIRLSASKAGTLSFTLRPTIPFLGSGKSGSVVAKGDTITLSGVMSYFNVKFEGQFKVIPAGGTMKAANSKSQGTITVSDADSAVILIAVGTNYKFDPKVFLTTKNADKLAGFPHPHAKVTGYLADAAAKSYEQLLANHQADYTELYDRVSLDLGAAEPSICTDELVDAYPAGASSRYLEELAFQFGRYMLICSSRAGTLPPNLQGIWNVYSDPPWASQYLHDTNLQMAYAPAFCANMPDLFECYIGYFNAYVPRQRLYATQFIKQFNPTQLDPSGDNGWSGPFWTNPYNVPGRSIVAGFGTGSWIAQMFWDYYDYTRDKSLLADKVYPVMYDQANFVSRFVKDVDGVLLADPSSSPEQKFRDTVGTTFDQQMFYENHHNTLTAAQILGRSDSRLATFKTQLPLLDPIQIGKSGHIKEFRQEQYYGEIGDPAHRHTSMLLGLYPGQLINDTTPAWLDAAKVSLTKRTNKSRIGWSRAERIAMWARVHDGQEAYSYYKALLGGNYMHNLFNDHRGGPLFQADANYGATAGVAEMLLQSQDHVVAPLPALPAAWSEGSYRGLLARGNFEVSAQWSDGRASRLEVLSKSGGTLELRYPNVAQAVIKTPAGQTVNFVAKGSDQVRIETTQGQTYVVTDIPVCIPVIAPSNLKIDRDVVRNQIKLSWTGSADAASYNLYRAVGNAPDYELIASDVAGTDFVYKAPDLEQFDQMTLKVTAVRADGRESDEGAMVIRLLPQKVVVERWKAPKDGPGKWTLLSCKGQPDGRHETTFVECQGKFYLIGGRESRKIDRFDPQTKVWTKMKGTSPLIHHFQPVLWDNKIYMVGAMTGNYPKEPPMRRIQIYDPLRDQWTEGGEIPKARQRGSAGTVLYKNKIYMVGGITLGHTSGTNNWFDEYDPATDTWKILPDAPQIRDHFHAVVLDDKLYCIGGRNTSYHEPGNFAAFFGAVIREIDCYDFKTQTWTTLKAKLPVGSAAGGVAVLDGKIIYFGGETAQKGPALNRTWAFNPKTETWTELANLNQGRHGSQAIVYDNKVYIAAGSPNRGGGQTHTMEMFAF